MTVPAASSRPLPRLLLLLLLYAVLLAALAVWLPAPTRQWMFSEQGPFEELSIPFWVLAGAWCFDPVRSRRASLVVTGLLCWAAAAREADWDRAFTADSIFKLTYYRRVAAPLYEKIPAAIVTIAIFVLILTALWMGLRFALRGGGLSQVWLRTAALGVVVLGGVKTLDRLNNWVMDATGHYLPSLYSHIVAAYEEGFEMALPLIFALAIRQYRRATERPLARLD